jgi:hypothetical protein
MPTLTDQTGAVIDYLVAQCQTVAFADAYVTAYTDSYGPLPAMPPVTVSVFDGPTISDTQLVGTQRVWVGADGPASPGQEVEAATFAQDFAFIDHARTKDDRIDVACAAECFDGDPTRRKFARDSAFSLMGAVELLLRGDPSVPGPGDASMGGLVFWSQVTGPGQLIQAQTTDGISALVRFHVTAFTRLTT